LSLIAYEIIVDNILPIGKIYLPESNKIFNKFAKLKVLTIFIFIDMENSVDCVTFYSNRQELRVLERAQDA